MKIFKIGKISIAFACFMFSIASYSRGDQPHSLISYLAYSTSPEVQIIRRDYATGIGAIIDSTDTSNPGFSHGVGWQMYDPVHRRLFFQEGLTDTVIYPHVYEIDTHRYFDLPYSDYSGTHVTMIISPDSRYIIFTYRFMPHDTIWSQNQYKTIILDGDNLSQVSESVGIIISDTWHGDMSFVTRNNRFLLNPDYIRDTDSTGQDAMVVYSLPNLQPLDTLFQDRFEWRGFKRPIDYSEDGLLFIAQKADSSRNLPPGSYAFIASGPNRRIVSRIIPIARNDDYDDARINPTGDEILVLYPTQGKLRRYSIGSGRLIGEIDIPMGRPVGTRFILFGDDGNLYINSRHFILAIDYRNNRILRTFRFEQ